MNCLQRAARRIAPIDGLRSGRAEAGHLSVVWAACSDAPVSVKADSDEGAALVWGRPLRADTDVPVTADDLHTVWPDAGRRTDRPVLLDGYFAALSYRSTGTLVAGADLLGMFPIYYWCWKDVLLIASSPQLFTNHAYFDGAFNPRALCGILLTSHLVDGQCLYEGVRRLQAGHRLVWRADAPPREDKQYSLPASQRWFDMPFSAHVELLDDCIGRAVKRHVPNDCEHALMLSGGMDSRMLGGYLKRNRLRSSGLTMGRRRDNELKCAKQVARALGMSLHIDEVDLSEFAEYADMQVYWEHLANGFNTVHSWGIPRIVSTVATRVVTGYLLDAVVGPHYMTWPYSESSRDMSYTQFFQNLNEYGLAPEQLDRLLKHEMFGDNVALIQQFLRDTYESYSDLDSQRAWCFNLAHRQRFHVGPILWRLSFGAWPSVPVLDRHLLDCAGGMPAATLAERRAQQELLCCKFPDLARIPLDRNSIDIKPLKQRLRHLLAQHALTYLRPVRQLKKRVLPNRYERRRYFRIYDFNSSHWRVVRQAAEAGRDRMLEYFDGDELSKLVPESHVPVVCERAINRTSGLKLLVGFMLWAASRK